MPTLGPRPHFQDRQGRKKSQTMRPGELLQNDARVFPGRARFTGLLPSGCASTSPEQHRRHSGNPQGVPDGDSASPTDTLTLENIFTEPHLFSLSGSGLLAGPDCLFPAQVCGARSTRANTNRKDGGVLCGPLGPVFAEHAAAGPQQGSAEWPQGAAELFSQ